MNRGDIVNMLEGEARRKPLIADLLARVDTLTDEEIDTAVVPLKWYRDALREARRRSIERRNFEQIEHLAGQQTIGSVETSENLKRGLTLEYTGENFWAKARRGFQVEVRAGDHIFFPEDGSGAWLNQIFFDNPPMQFKQSRRVTEQTRYHYLLDYQKNLLSLPCEGSTVVSDTPAQPRHRGGRGFTIY